MAVQAPVNYGIDVAPLNPAQQIMQGMAVGQGLLDAREQGLQRQQAAELRPLQMQQAQLAVRTGLAAEADANAARALAEAAQKSQAIAAAEKAAARQRLATEPLTVDALQRFTILYPEESKALEESMKRLSTEERRQFVSDAGQARAALESGNQEAAVSFLQGRAQARKEAGDVERAEAMQRFAEQARQNPVLARNMLAAFIASDDPEKFAENETKLLTQAGTVREGEAKAQVAEAQATVALDKAIADVGLTNAQAERFKAQTAIESARLGLDRERLALDKLKAQQERAAALVNLTEPAQKRVVEASDKAVKANAMAAKAAELAVKFEGMAAAGVMGGRVAMVGEGIKRELGMEDAVSQARAQFEEIKTGQVLASLPPGAASDTDIALASKPLPSGTSDPKIVASYLRGLEKINRFAEVVAKGEADYVSQNGGVGMARQNMTVNGVQVPAGSTYGEVLEALQRRALRSAVPAPAQAPPVAAPAGGRRSASGMVQR